jgi:hypothetical protein
MANDISEVISANPIKNGSVVTSSTVTGRYLTYNRFVNNNPSINNIENKYDDRFIDGLLIRFGANQTIVGG